MQKYCLDLSDKHFFSLEQIEVYVQDETFFIFYQLITAQIKFGYYEKATKFEKIFHLKFDVTE